MTWSERTVVRDGVRVPCRDRSGGDIRPGLLGRTGRW
ncbi:hypothetical protein RKD28_000179 [Streptomyces sp. SAI-229]|jgi:hypothetical protein